MSFSHPLISGAPIRLEPGFKFSPSDVDIVVHYLHPRAMNEPFPFTFIVDANVLRKNPWDLVPEGSMEKYYFSQRVLSWPHGNRRKHAAGDGYWKASGKDVPIFSNGINDRVPLKVGLKKTMVFYRGNAPVGDNTEWMMEEYSLAEAGLFPCRVMRPRGSSNIGKCGCAAAVIAKKNDELSEALRKAIASLNKDSVLVYPDDSWVVCRIYKKKKKCMPGFIARGYNIAGRGQVPFFDFIGQANPEWTASSSSLTGTQHSEKENADKYRGQE
ncbi:unnamed protein product [Urochloa decumbens]|uniref:NAC domain-containing protein n=1 Tax=Urochloa decumbens TaxID=240449 RepID=A0ABC9B2Y1_9POAL